MDIQCWYICRGYNHDGTPEKLVRVMGSLNLTRFGVCLDHLPKYASNSKQGWHHLLYQSNDLPVVYHIILFRCQFESEIDTYERDASKHPKAAGVLWEERVSLPLVFPLAFRHYLSYILRLSRSTSGRTQCVHMAVGCIRAGSWFIVFT